MTAYKFGKKGIHKNYYLVVKRKGQEGLIAERLTQEDVLS